MQIFAAGRIIATAMVDPNLDERFERDDCFSFHSVIAFATLVEVEKRCLLFNRDFIKTLFLVSLKIEKMVIVHRRAKKRCLQL